MLCGPAGLRVYRSRARPGWCTPDPTLLWTTLPSFRIPDPRRIASPFGSRTRCPRLLFFARSDAPTLRNARAAVVHEVHHVPRAGIRHTGRRIAGGYLRSASRNYTDSSAGPFVPVIVIRRFGHRGASLWRRQAADITASTRRTEPGATKTDVSMVPAGAGSPRPNYDIQRSDVIDPRERYVRDMWRPLSMRVVDFMTPHRRGSAELPPRRGRQTSSCKRLPPASPRIIPTFT
jgi:hypothetical protein